MRYLASCVIFLSLCVAGSCQSTDDHGFTFHAGAGYTPLVGDLSHNLDNGWNVQFGGGYMFTSHLGLIAEYQRASLGVPDHVLTELSVPDGSAWVHSVTFGPEIRFAPDRRVSPYLIGGVGWYRRTIEFTRPTTATITAFDPFFGVFFPAVVPADVVIGDITRDGFGGNFGGGVNFRIGQGKAKVFAEARYHRAAHDGADTEMVPVTIGLRW